MDYTVELELDLDSIVPGVAGPKRPQDRINLAELKRAFQALFEKPVAEGGYGKKSGDLVAAGRRAHQWLEPPSHTARAAFYRYADESSS